MRITLLAGVALAVVTWPVGAQIAYEVRFPNAAHHEAEIAVTFTDLRPGTLELRMSRSSPGRYAIHEFAKNVYRVRATDERGRELSIARPNPYQWDVTGHHGTVTVTYTLFADRGGGTYSQVDRTHAHLNMPATFMWGRGLDDRAIVVRFHPPAGSNWNAATQLAPADEPMTFTAPNFQYFMDSPTELSDFTMRSWEVESGGTRYTIRMAVHHEGTAADVEAYAEMARKVVDQEIAVYGEPPDYDYGTYTFIADYLPYISGDGMEHRNSTVIARRGELRTEALRMLGTVSHEFFHCWNVERIRPRSLEPFDFERANMSDALWFAEGFTSYYTPLMIRRAGLYSDERYAGGLSGDLNYVINSPGRQFFNPMQMSMQAPFVDAATAIDPTNQQNTFISYYTWGAVIGLNLDLTLRSRFDRTLDGFMAAMWTKYGKPEVPYTVADLEATLGEFTGDAAFARSFFDRFVRGREVPDYAALLANAGLLVRKAHPGQAVMGEARLEYDGRGATLASGTIIGTPLYEAGLDRGDRIVRLDGRSVGNASDVQAALGAHRPGDEVSVEFESRGGPRTATLTLVENPDLEVVTYEEAGMAVSEAMRRFREHWLGGKGR